MQSLTQRDKKILVFLAIFVIVTAVLVWGVLPISANISQNMSFLDATNEQVERMQENIASYDDSVKKNDELKQELSEVSDGYYEVMQSQDVDKLITSVVVAHGLSSQELTIVKEEDAKAMPVYYTSSLEEGSPLFYVYNVRVRATGAPTAVLSLINTFTEDYPAIRVVSYDITDYSSYDMLELNLEIYMYEK